MTTMGLHSPRSLLTKAGLFPGKTTRATDLQGLVRDLRAASLGPPLVRVGPAGDGGYLLPDDLAGITRCFSPGVANCSDFELELANRGMEVFMADRSVDGPAAAHPRFHFVKKFLASMDAPEEGLVTLDTWVRDNPAGAQGGDALLQMDIEGAEYEVLHATPEATLAQFRIVVVEFHRLHQLADRFSFRWMSGAFRKLLRTHAVVHLHPNNCRGAFAHAGVEIPQIMEFTFLRRDRATPGLRAPQFPHPLDRVCVAGKADLVLPRCWRAD